MGFIEISAFTILSFEVLRVRRNRFEIRTIPVLVCHNFGILELVGSIDHPSGEADSKERDVKVTSYFVKWMSKMVFRKPDWINNSRDTSMMTGHSTCDQNTQRIPNDSSD